MGLTLAPNIISQHRRFIINFGILSIASNFMNYSAALLLFSTAFVLFAIPVNCLYHALADRCARELNLNTSADNFADSRRPKKKSHEERGVLVCALLQLSMVNSGVQNANTASREAFRSKLQLFSFTAEQCFVLLVLQFPEK